MYRAALSSLAGNAYTPLATRSPPPPITVHQLQSGIVLFLRAATANSHSSECSKTLAELATTPKFSLSFPLLSSQGLGISQGLGRQFKAKICSYTRVIRNANSKQLQPEGHPQQGGHLISLN